jgi:hypothetical protein
MDGLVAAMTMLVMYGLPVCLTAVGSHRRGNTAAECVVYGLAWPWTWVHWFVTDNRAAGRGPFQGHRRET